MPGDSKVSAAALEQELCDRFERALPKRNLTVDCVVQIGTVSFLLRIEEGSIRECRKGLPLLCSWAFAMRGSAKGWAALWQNPPPPGWHDIFALTKRGEMVLEGSLHLLMANLQYFKDVVALPREGGSR
jgi:hypothetical protein